MKVSQALYKYAIEMHCLTPSKFEDNSVEKALLQQGNAFTGEYDDMKFLANPMVNMSLVVGGEGDEVKDKKIIYQNQYVMNDMKIIIMNKN